MRLTLRTLLAYLDNTLDPEDAKALREKLGESGFATQLVQRIRDTLANSGLAAPSPKAVGPVEEANVISEYLDSTLPAEQVAEIERACLESDPHLAEAAACHQILTMVLGKSAEVSPELRQRIYELPENNIEEVAAVSGSFSSVSIPEQPSLASIQDSIPTAPGEDDASRSSDVQPVGIADSGVSDAPTRLREAGVVDDSQPAEGSAAIAGARPRGIEDAAMYGRSIRTSRITPWLVSLALTAVLLFALTRIFAPLLNKQTTAAGGSDDVANVDTTPQDVAAEPPVEELQTPPAEVEASVADTPPMVSVGDAQADVDPRDDLPPADDETLPSPNASPAVESVEETETPELVAPNPSGAQPVEMQAEPTPLPAGDLAAPAPSPETPDVASVDLPPPPAEAENVAADQGKDDLAAPDNVSPPAAVELAKVTSSDGLIAGIAPDKTWVRLPKDSLIGEGVKILTAPTFRSQMKSAADISVTAIDATQVHWSADGENDSVSLNVDFGRVLLSAIEPDTSLDVVLGDHPVTLTFADVDTVIAATVGFERLPGLDPTAVDNRVQVTDVMLIQGTTKLTSDDSETELMTGQQWSRRGDTGTEVSPVEEIPAWMDPPDPNAATLEASAREGLLAILGDGQTLELPLREATAFRRSEVGALAARTLLAMGRADVYFGSDGVLSQPKQRAYWSDHFGALLDVVDRSAEGAEQVNQAIANMDSANARELQRLLVGYSQKQLVEGGDEELVKLLDSQSMAVRVLALENLHRITGTTLYFRAEQDNAIRREPGIKKWEVRQRKGDIRWSE